MSNIAHILKVILLLFKTVNYSQQFLIIGIIPNFRLLEFSTIEYQQSLVASRFLLGYSRIPVRAKFDILVITISSQSRSKCRSSGASVNFIRSSRKASQTFLGYIYSLYYFVSSFLIFFLIAFKPFTPPAGFQKASIIQSDRYQATSKQLQIKRL